MLDPLISLAFSMQSNKGAYALLLGSGVSRSSRIPTGWEIVLELIRKVAVLSEEQCEPDPAAWYAAKFGEQPDYGKLLDMVAKTPSERQQLLRAYFEPSADEQGQGVKMPTKAHRAIAKLAFAGYVRVIITTNFDRLMERALEDEGIAPVVLSAPDHIEGAVPLAHMKCCVVKVHGDYLDTRIRNTPTELAEYDERMDAFLGRVFDEFGLVTCGWSGDWDTALRVNIERAPTRRYSMFWASRGEPSQAAKDLIARRGGLTLPINDADSFFDHLQTKIESIEEFSKPHPLSKDIAVASVKRFLSDSQHRIRLADLIENLGKALSTRLRAGPFADVSTNPDRETITQKVRTYESMATTLTAVALTCGKWGDESVAKVLGRSLDRIYAARQNSGLSLWLNFQNYPATLVAYAALLGASLGDNLLAMSKLFEGKVRQHNTDVPLSIALPPACFLEDARWGQLLKGMDRRYVPVSDWMQKTLWSALGEQFISEEEFQMHFDWVEIIVALACHQSRGPSSYGDWFPSGSYGHRPASREKVCARILSSLDEFDAKSEYVLAGLFGTTVDECRASLAGLNGFTNKLGWGW
jgi:hypothetical protein